MTHDIGEALKLGTKVLVMDQGSVQQFAPPREILHDPATDYVKKLVEKSAGGAICRRKTGRLRLQRSNLIKNGRKPGETEK